MSTIAEYRKLLVEYVPQPIRSEQAYQHTLRQLEKLMVPNPGAARSLLIEVLSTLIEQYESRILPSPNVPPSEMLAHLLEARNLTRAELARQTGVSPATLSSVLSEQRGISKQNAVALAKFFKVSPVLFLAEAVDPVGEFQPA